MNQKKKVYTITAALPYANGPLHIGHIAGCFLPADIYYRTLKLKNLDAIFICGSDEHGVPVTIRAAKENITPLQVVDIYHNKMKSAFEKFGINFSHYGRTSSQNHHEFAKHFFEILYTHNQFEEVVSKQYYDPEVNQFLADRYITGTCPKCSNPKAYGDQCEKCGTSLNPIDLIEPTSALSGSKPILKETKNWFLPLNHFQSAIENYIYGHQNDWKVNVFGQCKSWLNDGLSSRAMTRDLDWGVQLPQAVPNAEGKVMYVWFDAPLGYISNTIDYLPNDWKKYWIKDDRIDQELIHFIGKDNIVFHCIIFPSMLMAYNQSNSNEQYILPYNVPANEFLNLEGEKISTSRNWAVWLHEYLEDFPNRNDELRYYLTSIAPETKDSDFTWSGFQLAVNSELVAILGNFVNRVVVLSHKFFDGKIPQRHELLEIDLELFKGLNNQSNVMNDCIAQYKFREAMSIVMDLFRAGNKYFADTEPWHSIKTDLNRTETVMNVALSYCYQLGVLLQPFLPETANKIFNLYQLYPTENSYNDVLNGDFISLNIGHEMGPAIHLFKNIEDSEIQIQIDRLKNSLHVDEVQNPLNPIKDIIQFDDFSKIDIRVATIIEAEKVPKADKLLKLVLDTGIDQRIVVSGIAEYYKPEDIIGKQVSLIANLAPRKMKGIESQGMILMAKDQKGKLHFVSPSDMVNPGADIS